MSFIGNTPTTQSFISGTETFNGTGAQTAYTLTRSVASVNDIQITINNVVQQPNVAYTVLGNVVTFTSAPSAGTSNIYVRYLSTTTQSITPSQGTVQYSSLNADNQSKLGISFKNRIINGAMVIDQRNAGASVNNGTTGVYTLDRWKTYGSASAKFSIQQNAGAATPPPGFVNYVGLTSLAATTVGTSDEYDFYQLIEGYNVADLNWGNAYAKTITLSFWARSSITGSFGGSIRNTAATRSYPFTYTISATNTWQQFSITVPGCVDGVWETTTSTGIIMLFGLGVGSTLSGTAGAWANANYASATGATQLVATSGATLYLTGVQLEVGTQATTFDYRSYGTELALCQRYAWLIPNSNLTAGDGAIIGAFGYISSTSVYVGAIQFPVSMRNNPTISVTGTANYEIAYTDGTVTTIAGTSISQSTSNINTISSLITATGSGHASQPAFLRYATRETTPTFLISAEL